MTKFVFVFRTIPLRIRANPAEFMMAASRLGLARLVAALAGPLINYSALSLATRSYVWGHQSHMFPLYMYMNMYICIYIYINIYAHRRITIARTGS